MQVITLLDLTSVVDFNLKKLNLFRVDTDGDGDIDEDELQKWIKLQIMDYVQRDAQQVRIEIETEI